MSSPIAHPRRSPRQERSRLMVSRILDAGRTVLIKHGYDGTTTNLIAKEADTLIFIEVKTRTSPTAPEVAVTPRKQQLIASAAAQYQELIDHNWAIRFDIITVNYYSPQNFTLEHFKDAFFPGL